MNAKQSDRGKSLRESAEHIIEHDLWKKILIGMILGVGLGMFLSGFASLEAMTDTIGEWLSLPGVAFLGLIQMVIVPLIVCSVILGISESGDIDFLANMSGKLLIYFVLTTALSISIGLTLVNIIQPGQYIDQSFVAQSMEEAKPISDQNFEDLSIPDRIKNVIPNNLDRAVLERNMLQIVIASILFGIALITLPKASGKPVRDILVTGQMLCMRIISWAMIIAPYAVFGMMVNVTIKMGASALVSLAVYALTVVLGLLCVMIVYLLLIWMVGGRSPLNFLAAIRNPQLLAFSTSSSAATMPFSIQAAEENLNIKHEVSRFVIPIGTTINMDGTSLYQAVAAVFLTQIFGIELTLTETLLLLVTTIGASIGTPGIPGVGIIVLSTLLIGIGVPVEGIALIIGIDRLLDMCRTTINVTGDITASVVMERLTRKS